MRPLSKTRIAFGFHSKANDANNQLTVHSEAITIIPGDFKQKPPPLLNLTCIRYAKGLTCTSYGYNREATTTITTVDSEHDVQFNEIREGSENENNMNLRIKRIDGNNNMACPCVFKIVLTISEAFAWINSKVKSQTKQRMDRLRREKIKAIESKYSLKDIGSKNGSSREQLKQKEKAETVECLNELARRRSEIRQEVEETFLKEINMDRAIYEEWRSIRALRNEMVHPRTSPEDVKKRLHFWVDLKTRTQA
ncbi:hypothetical protein BCR41DRAFT_369526 [Lobosporangium transversale]|uniref:Uncharacterized protein n=1 Tax=Lobosporangium transversale TaxID=64571 RepID=A0A1Y2GS33_9FUNG|nr:hypothetical protein BCR41DRAFT_369526 [Lobosporangium transversale]ORZ20926.1 hypothetical protein BCR41DRAFT_369526 [Lobosporangium transversale]|eukprot:XP_021882835.1 hypothetical protein BCR41DRAFT_369526 [Lobosporangium transversale]